MTIEELFKLMKSMVQRGASDLHLRVGACPTLRIEGVLRPQEGYQKLTPDGVQEVYLAITSAEQQKTFSRELELDFAYSIPGLARFRVNVLQQRGTLSIAFRMVPIVIPSIDELGLPSLLKDLIMAPRGLILLTGHTGAGKSTTLAAMINYLNRHERRNIITIEDPVEFLYTDDKCIIAQRDVGDDTRTFQSALTHVLRHDPDVVVIGELRDLNTISTALTAAETGHLVIGTLHTSDASQTIDRIVDVFPSSQQQQVAFQLSQVLVAVLSQTLLPRLEGGRVAAFEILVANNAVRNLIRDMKSFQLPGLIQLGARDGMQTLDQSLADLVKRNIIARDKAMMKTSDPVRLAKLLKGPTGFGES